MEAEIFDFTEYLNSEDLGLEVDSDQDLPITTPVLGDIHGMSFITSPFDNLSRSQQAAAAGLPLPSNIHDTRSRIPPYLPTSRTNSNRLQIGILAPSGCFLVPSEFSRSISHLSPGQHRDDRNLRNESGYAVDSSALDTSGTLTTQHMLPKYSTSHKATSATPSTTTHNPNYSPSVTYYDVPKANMDSGAKRVRPSSFPRKTHTNIQALGTSGSPSRKRVRTDTLQSSAVPASMANVSPQLAALFGFPYEEWQQLTGAIESPNGDHLLADHLTEQETTDADGGSFGYSLVDMTTNSATQSMLMDPFWPKGRGQTGVTDQSYEIAPDPDMGLNKPRRVEAFGFRAELVAAGDLQSFTSQHIFQDGQHASKDLGSNKQHLRPSDPVNAMCLKYPGFPAQTLDPFSPRPQNDKRFPPGTFVVPYNFGEGNNVGAGASIKYPCGDPSRVSRKGFKDSHSKVQYTNEMLEANIICRRHRVYFGINGKLYRAPSVVDGSSTSCQQ